MRTFEVAQGRGPCIDPKFKLTHYQASESCRKNEKLLRNLGGDELNDKDHRPDENDQPEANQIQNAAIFQLKWLTEYIPPNINPIS